MNRAPNPSFEVDLGGWILTGGGNTATHVTTSSEHGVGAARLAGTGTANREFNFDTSFATPTIPGAVWSAGCWAKWETGATPRNIRVDIRFMDDDFVDITPLSLGTSTATNTSTWVQATCLNKTAPAGTAYVRARCVYLNNAANDAGLVDAFQLVQGATLPAFEPDAGEFMPDVVVEIAFASTPDDDTPTWVDVSEYVEATTPITISRGRSDELTEIQPSRLTVTLDNTDGRFTPGNTESPYYPNVKKNRQIRVSATPVDSTVRRRFHGYVDEWPVAWPSGTDEYATTVISASSRRARLALGAELPSIVETEYLLDRPTFYYPMGEPPPMAGSTGQAGDVSGNQQPNLAATGAGFITWQGATGPGSDDLSAPVFADNGRFLLLAGHPLYGPSDLSVTVEAFVNTEASGSIDIAVSWFGGGTYNDLGIDAAGHLRASSGSIGGGSYFFLQSAATINDGETHHVAVRQTYVAGAMTATLFLDGVQVDTAAAVTEPSAFTNHTRLVVGKYAEPGDAVGNSGWVGSISHVAIFAGGTEVSAARIAGHAGSGLSGFEGDSSDARIERLATYAGVPAGQVDTEPGLSTSLGVQRTDGKTPLALMEEATDTEGGVLFDATDGTLTFHSRGHRYSTASVLTLDAGLQQIESAVEPRLDGQQMVNDLTVTGATGLSLRVANQDSIDEHGLHRDQLELLTTDDAELLDAATWRINRYGEPDVRIHSVAVDLLNSPPDLIPLLLDAEIGDRITLANLPVQAPSSSYDGLIEGISESIGAESYTIAFELSPVSQSDVWQLDSASYSQLDETTVLAY